MKIEMWTGKNNQDPLVDDTDGMITITAYVIGALIALCCLAWCLGISVH